MSARRSQGFQNEEKIKKCHVLKNWMFSLEYKNLFRVYIEILYEGLGRKTAFFVYKVWS